MRILGLSTRSKHHTYFLCKLYQHFDIVGLAYERRGLVKEYPTGPFFKEEEDQFEEKFFDPSVGGTPRHLPSEVWGCKKDLEKHLGHGVDLFSYPEGQAEHFDQRVIRELKSAGITICPSAVHGVNGRGEDPFYLKRVMVGFMGERFPFAGYEAGQMPVERWL